MRTGRPIELSKKQIEEIKEKLLGGLSIKKIASQMQIHHLKVWRISQKVGKRKFKKQCACGKTFETFNPNQVFCSTTCRKKTNNPRRRKRDALAKAAGWKDWASFTTAALDGKVKIPSPPRERR